jgi:hypothetical protein
MRVRSALKTATHFGTRQKKIDFEAAVAIVAKCRNLIIVLVSNPNSPVITQLFTPTFPAGRNARTNLYRFDIL